MVKCLLLIVPLVGLIAFVYNCTWLFYVTGGIAFLSNIIYLLGGESGCWTSTIMIVGLILGYVITDRILDGVFLGSLLFFAFLYTATLFVFLVSFVIAITNTIVEYIKRLFGCY